MTFDEWWEQQAKLSEREKLRLPTFGENNMAWQAWHTALNLAQPQWQPIETAPSDEFILMYLPLANGYYEIHILAITEYGLIDTFDDVTTYGIDDFTHWMPLPEPPK